MNSLLVDVNMKAIILAAGKGKRMRHLTENLPKPLLKVGGQTLLDHIFDALPEAVNEVIVVVGYLGGRIREYLGENYKGRKIHYVVQEKLNGTAGALLAAKDYFDSASRERFLIFYGDELITKKDVEECLARELSWLCWEVANPQASGIANVSDAGFITEVVEKPKYPKSNLAAGGVMVVNADIFNYRPDPHETGEYYLTSMMNKFLKTRPVYAVKGTSRSSFSVPEDIERYEKLMETNRN